MILKTLLAASILLLVLPVSAAQVTVATAANFTAAIRRLAPEFERRSGHTVVASFGATGTLYAQIRNGAPFDILLAADAEHPLRLETEGLAVAGTRFTYAIGRLALWSAKPGVVDKDGEILRRGEFAHLAIANPKTAPYGMAAVQVLQRLGVEERVRPRIVQGENITQTFQFVSTGNALLGFVAWAQVRALPATRAGSSWLVPAELHDPLNQDGVLLKRAADPAAARAFLDYLRSPPARSVITELGYTTPP